MRYAIGNRISTLEAILKHPWLKEVPGKSKAWKPFHPESLNHKRIQLYEGEKEEEDDWGGGGGGQGERGKEEERWQGKGPCASEEAAGKACRPWGQRRARREKMSGRFRSWCAWAIILSFVAHHDELPRSTEFCSVVFTQLCGPHFPASLRRINVVDRLAACGAQRGGKGGTKRLDQCRFDPGGLPPHCRRVKV
jgi:hypothetical protein